MLKKGMWRRCLAPLLALAMIVGCWGGDARAIISIDNVSAEYGATITEPVFQLSADEAWGDYYLELTYPFVSTDDTDTAITTGGYVLEGDKMYAIGTVNCDVSQKTVNIRDITRIGRPTEKSFGAYTFELKPSSPHTTYKLTVVGGYGSGAYRGDAKVTIIAPSTNDDGESFIRWAIDNDSKGTLDNAKSNVAIFTMDYANATVTAIYKEDTPGGEDDGDGDGDGDPSGEDPTIPDPDINPNPNPNLTPDTPDDDMLLPPPPNYEFIPYTELYQYAPPVVAANPQPDAAVAAAPKPSGYPDAHSLIRERPTNQVQVFSDPSYTSRPLADLTDGDSLLIYGAVDVGGGWLMIDWPTAPEGVAYVHRLDVILHPTEPLIDGKENPLLVAVPEEARLGDAQKDRPISGENGERIGTVRAGTYCVIVDETESAYTIMYGDITGTVSKQYITVRAVER